MPAPLLSTKLYIPPLRATQVPRPRLIDSLNAGLNSRLILISAPAGYGKTTLLSNWIAACQMPVAWVSLDESDNDLVRFLYYIVSALQKIEPKIGETTLSMLEFIQGTSIETALTTLLNEIAGMPAPFALILDDYHTLSAQTIHDAMTFILNHIPPQMHLVISTRSDPPLPIARLRARGQMIELRQNDLRFTADEAVRFLSESTRLNLTAGDIATLVSRTEGWITGLQMAALSMQHHEDISGFIAGFTGSQHHILDYLIEEVLKRQPEHIQAFLLQTSILDRMSGSLCDAVTSSLAPSPSSGNQGRSSQAMLEYLEHANLFVLPMDENLHWYRYHHLFADCLVQRLYQQAPELVSELHCRAARWYAHNGFEAEAISHLLAAGDWLDAARLVEQYAIQMFARGETSALLPWLNQLPDDLVRERPMLCILHAWTAYICGRYEVAEQRLQAAEQALEKQTQLAMPAGHDKGSTWTEIQLRAHIAAVRAFTAIAEEEFVRASELARQALEHLPEMDFARSLAWLALGWAARLRGNLETAKQAFVEARRVGLATNFTYAAVSATCRLGYLHMLQGRLHQAAENYREALLLATDRSEQRAVVAGYAQVHLSDIYREWNDLNGALYHVMDGIELCKRVGHIRDWAAGYITLARICLAQKDLDGARDALQNAWRLFQMPVQDPLVHCWLQDCQVRLWLAQGDLAAATRWMQACGLTVTDEISFTRELEHLLLARVLVAQGQTQPKEPDLTSAVSLLTRLLKTAESMGWTRKAVEAMILLALAWQVQGRMEQALTVLARALTLTESEGYVRIYIDEGPPMAKLLRQAAAQGIAPAYTGELLTIFGKKGKETGLLHWIETQNPPSLHQTDKLIEPLSERELEVLRLLSTDLSSTAIAARLYVSASTIRSHLRNIYGKLGVHSRYEAVTRAQEVKLT